MRWKGWPMVGNSPSDIAARAREAWRPPPRLRLSEWADQNFYLSAESSAEPGRWRTIPYQRGMLDAITDPWAVSVTIKKSARVGYTKMLDIAAAYYIVHDPCPIMIVQPTETDAEEFSKEEIAPMLRDVPLLENLISAKTRDSSNTILHKTFRNGAVLQMVGANSPTGFRRVSRKIVMFDEVDGYPPSAGAEGDPIRLGIKRSEYFWDRKIIAGSTPTIAGASRIERRHAEGDQRYFNVPCPHCGEFQVLKWKNLKWPKGKPLEAHFVCEVNGCIIEEKAKRWMVERGQWVATAPENYTVGRHISFHIWAAYSYSPNAAWGQLATEFLAAEAAGVEELQTFINTVLGEVWQDRGEAPDYKRLYERREDYAIDSIPPGVAFLTCGVDVQKNRLVYEIAGWGEGRESWSVDAAEIPCDTANADDAGWAQLDALLAKQWQAPDGRVLQILMMAVDANYNTTQVVNWCRRYPMSRVMAVIGRPHLKIMLGPPSKIDVTINGKKIKSGYQYWPVGPDVAKAELYGWLKLPVPVDGAAYPPGFCHFPKYGEHYFKQLTGEQLVARKKKNGFVALEWEPIPGRENHYLDARIYARAAAAAAGIDRVIPKRQPIAPAGRPAPSGTAPAAEPARPPEVSPAPERSGGGWLNKGGSRNMPRGGSGFWGRRR